MLRLGLLTIGMAFAPFFLQSPAAAQERPKLNSDDRYYTVTRWMVRVYGYAGRVDEEFGPFPDGEAAEKAARAWSEARPNDLRLAMAKEVEYRIPIRRGSTPKPPPEEAPLSRGRGAEAPPAAPAFTPAEPEVAGVWVGQETANDTTSLKFVFGADGSVTAYDDTRNVWRGSWRRIGTGSIVIQLTSPHAVNYSGQIDGDRMSGKAGRPGARGQWSWSVSRR